MVGLCALCEREAVLTRHHLIPRTRQHNKRNKRDFSRELVRSVIGLCRSCHAQIHQLLSVKELEREYNTLAKLRSHPRIEEFVQWIRSKPPGFRATMRNARALRSSA